MFHEAKSQGSGTHLFSAFCFGELICLRHLWGVLVAFRGDLEVVDSIHRLQRWYVIASF
jgi:hypothetical protein